MTEIDTSRANVEKYANATVFITPEAGADQTAAMLRALLARAEKAEAERDEAWNAAIEAAANEAMRENERRLALASIRIPAMACEIRDAIRALKKGTDQ